MAKRSTSIVTITPTATADSATDLVDATYPFLARGASTTQRTAILEVYFGGQATASAPTYMLLARSNQVGSGTNALGTGQTDAALDAATAALAAPVLTGNSNATNKPRRSTTEKLLNLSFNAFGGLVRWVAAPGEEIYIVGNTNPLGEVTVAAFTGGTPGALGGHMIYETT
jgi:hypothetical protein